MAGGAAGPGPPGEAQAPRGIVDQNIERAHGAPAAVAPWQYEDDSSSVLSEKKRSLRLNPLRLLRKHSQRATEGAGEERPGGRRWWHRRNKSGSRELCVSEISDAFSHVHALMPEPLRHAVSRDYTAPRDVPAEGRVSLDTNMDHVDDIVAPADNKAAKRASVSTDGSVISRQGTPDSVSGGARPAPALPIALTQHDGMGSPDTSGEIRREALNVSPKTVGRVAGPEISPTNELPSSNWHAPDSWAVEGTADDNVSIDSARLDDVRSACPNVVVLDSPTSMPSTRQSSMDTYDFTRLLPRRTNRIDTLFAPELATTPRRNLGSEEEDKMTHRPSILSIGSGVAAAAAGRLGLNRGTQSGFRRFACQRRSGSDASLTPAPALVRDDDEERCALGRRMRMRSDVHPEPYNELAEEIPLGVHYLRVYLADVTFLMIACNLEATVADVSAVLSRRLAVGDARAYRLFVVEKGSDRPLDPAESPAKIKDRRLLQAGYTREDDLEELGKEDLSNILRFVFRPDSVPALTSNMLGEQRHRYEHLNLMDMHLEMVPVFVYRHADWIVSLDLSMNPISELPLDFAQQCRNLRRLRISSLALKYIPPAVCAMHSLTHLDVSSNRIHVLSDTALPELEQLTSINLLNNCLTTLPSYISQLHALQCVNLSNNSLDVFPRVLCSVPTLVDIDVSFNAITEVPAEIARLTHLERLILRGNFISRLPEELHNLEYLAELDVGINTLQSLGRLLEQPRMTRVYVPHNCLTSLDARLGDLLSTVVLHHNPISRAQLVAPHTAGLSLLDLSHANLASLSPALFAHLGSLTELVLDYNQFTALPSNIGGLQQLETLSCAGNMLATLPDAIGELRMLARLDVHGNNLRALPSTLWKCANLYSINASSNILDTLIRPPPEGGPAAAPLRSSLMALRVADNRLTDDVFSLLVLFSELEVLNLSSNDIYEIPHGGLASLGELRELYMSGNKLSSLPSDDFEVLTELRVLFLNGNRLLSLPAELGRLKQLHSFDVSNNQLKYNIANSHYDWNWNSNPELRYLNFSGNQRFEIRPIIVRVNGSDKNIADFARLKSLHLLGLKEVTVTHQPLPDENETRRVRTTQQHINTMPYGISDTLGHHNSIKLFDMVTPAYRKLDNEALFGLFEGHGGTPHASGDIAYFLAGACAPSLAWELERISAQMPLSDATVETALRRTFLRLDRLYAERINPPIQSRAQNAATSMSRGMWRAGAGAVVAYLRGNVLHVANIGTCLAVVSRVGGLVNVLGTKHDALNRTEFQRVRRAEGFVSLRGYVNDEIPVTRSFGHYTLSAIASAEPSIVSVHLNDADEFVILANSVFWEFVPHQMAVDLARMDREAPKRAAQRLRDTAIAFGAHDQVAVMVVTVAALFHEAFDVRTLNVRALHRGIAESRKIVRRTRNDNDSTLARLEREVLPPIGHVAIVFTDIKNSTLLWDTNPGMQSAMRLHNQLLRRQLRSIGGYEVKTEGDAFMVSFQSVGAAVLWCFSVQIRLLSVDWPQEILDSEDGKTVHDADGNIIYRGLSVRMGVHWGWPVCEVDPVNTRMDYFGPMVNRAARISGAADGGQIMVSHDVIAEIERLMSMYEELNSSQGGDANDQDRIRQLHPNVPRELVYLRRLGMGIINVGERRLKGIETPEHLSLVYPKILCQRFNAPALTASSGGEMQMYEPTSQLIELEQLRLLAMLCLRLESLCDGKTFPGISTPADGNRLHLPAERTSIVASKLSRYPELLLGLNSRDEATDSELAVVLSHLIGRIRNCASTLMLQRALDNGTDMSALLESVRTMLEI